MKEITTVAIDLAKRVFQLHGTDAQGRPVLRRKVGRRQLEQLLAQLPPCTVVMEACSTSHHWARTAKLHGHSVRLIAAQHVKPFARGQKNDRNDAEAIACAARQPGLPEVAVKSKQQQSVLDLHGVRERLIRERVALVNQLHGIFGEFGLVLPKALGALKREALSILDTGGVEDQMLEATLREQLEHLGQIEARIASITERLEHLARNSEPCQRLMGLRGVGPIIATAFVAEIGDPGVFHNGRQVSAWLGLVPRQHSSGSRTRLLGITKRGNSYLRKQLIHGARSALRCACRHDDPVSRWALQVQQRRGWNRACVALANKIARRLWAALRYEPQMSLA